MTGHRISSVNPPPLSHGAAPPDSCDFSRLPGFNLIALPVPLGLDGKAFNPQQVRHGLVKAQTSLALL